MQPASKTLMRRYFIVCFNDENSKKICFLQEAENFFGAFKQYNEVKEFLDKLEKEKKVESKLDAALAKYKDLPPDLLLAKEVLKKQEKEMKDLSAEIEFLKNNMDDGVLNMFNP